MESYQNNADNRADKFVSPHHLLLENKLNLQGKLHSDLKKIENNTSRLTCNTCSRASPEWCSSR